MMDFSSRARRTAATWLPWILAALCLPLWGQDLTIRDVNIVDVAKGAVLSHKTVIIKNGKIDAVRDGGASGTGINGSGKYLIPGMWDMHVHNWEKTSLYGLYVATGVLGIRDLGSDRAQTKKWQAQVEAGTLIGPRLVTSGPIVDGPGPNKYPKLPVETIRTPADVPGVVDRLMKSGSDFIKPLSKLDRDSFFALADYTRTHKIVLAGHVPSAVSVWEAVKAGERSVEHMQLIPLACSSDEAGIRKAMADATAKNDAAASRALRQRAGDTFDEAHCVALFREMKQRNSWVDPTLVSGWIGQRRRTGEAQKEPGLKYIPQYLRTEWEAPSERLPAPTPAQLAQDKKDAEVRKRIVLAMKAAGVGILTGSDTGDPFVLPGFVVHDEMELLVQNGLSTAEALRAATLEPARFFGTERMEGTVEAGKVASLVMLNANPLENIANTRKIEAVVLRGKLLDRARLNELLADPK